MKIDSAIKDAVLELKKNKITSAMLDSELLMSKVIKKDRDFIILNSDEILKKKDYSHFKKLINDKYRW